MILAFGTNYDYEGINARFEFVCIILQRPRKEHAR